MDCRFLTQVLRTPQLMPIMKALRLPGDALCPEPAGRGLCALRADYWQGQCCLQFFTSPSQWGGEGYWASLMGEKLPKVAQSADGGAGLELKFDAQMAFLCVGPGSQRIFLAGAPWSLPTPQCHHPRTTHPRTT